MILPAQGMQGLGAPVARKTTRIELDPIVIEGKIPPKEGKTEIPWKWIGIAAGVGVLYLLARYARKKGRRGPLGVAA